jgi:16S rRNA (uracil1498-N3)-methyltransferase
MSERFFVTPPIAGDRATLIGDEARHLAAVMRAQVGDEVTLFDGCGAEFTGRIESIRKQVVELTIVSRRESPHELLRHVTLAVALPKGERQKWLVEKATELGVTRLVPLITQRGVAQPVESALVRLRRSALESCKQCGRNILLEITPAIAANDFFAAYPRQDDIRLIADPTGRSLRTIDAAHAPSIIAAIGPEGGFSPAELAAAHEAGWIAVNLGPRILRVETAALAVAAWAGVLL